MVDRPLVAWVQTEVDDLRSHVGDPERAHIIEDSIRSKVLTQIAEHSTDVWAADLAAVALTTAAVDFPRWYA